MHKGRLGEEERASSEVPSNQSCHRVPSPQNAVSTQRVPISNRHFYWQPAREQSLRKAFLLVVQQSEEDHLFFKLPVHLNMAVAPQR